MSFSVIERPVSDFDKPGTRPLLHVGTCVSSFGPLLAAFAGEALCALEFVVEASWEAAFAQLRQRWRNCRVSHEPTPVGTVLQAIARLESRPDSWRGMLRLYGTSFQHQVWRALLGIEYGRTASYRDIAAAIGAEGSWQAVGKAVGANPVSLIVPCHRVLCRNGELGGYRWGLERKRALLEAEGHAL